MAYIKLKVIDPEKLIFALEQDAKAGDQICLKDLNTIDFHTWNQAVNDNNNQLIAKKLAEQKDSLETSFQKDLVSQLELQEAKLKNEFNKKISTLENDKSTWEQEYKHLKDSLDEKINAKENEIKNQVNDKIKNLEKDKIQLASDLQIAKNDKEAALKEEAFKAREEQRKLLDTEKYKFNQQLEAKNNEINDLNNELDSLKRNRNLLSTKAIGEGLEQWCLDEYNLHMAEIATDCLFYKTNTLYDDNGKTATKNGHKPDFIMEVYDRDVSDKEKTKLGSVVLEMKTQGETGTQKNESFLKKLAQDTKNYGADYGVLVTELEPETTIVISRAHQYPNIFIVRPATMLSLLAVLRNLILKQKDVVLSQVQFKSSSEILDEWERFKNDLLENIIKHINTKVKDILKASETITKNANTIKENAEMILETYLKRMEKKINDYAIGTKIVKKINQLPPHPTNMLASDQALAESEEVSIKDHLPHK